ncbi:MAG: OB-fold nucleic acid binding domain-containing protein [Desulfurococcales archaeon]|nr:OB-fold nucleic acid binding domain-containing protein [Desulfurococcales archaeon]
MESGREEVRKISSLREGENDVNVRVRVIKTMDPKVVETRKGPRTISEAIVGDETGRIKMTLWGKHAGTLQEGQAVEVSGAWTTSYRGEVQLNVGYRGDIKEVSDEDVASEEEIPEETPKATRGYSGRGGFYKGGFGGYRSRNRPR